jgi:ABC-type nickel/cobalt efflux system permease component RcnA
MPDWLIAWLGEIQAGVMGSLAGSMRAGSLGTAGLAFALGALHALTPGHGKSALAAYFLGREARLGKALRVALAAALLHVLSGLAAFLLLRFLIGQAMPITDRGSPLFMTFGYGLIALAGAVTLGQSMRAPHQSHHDGAHALTAGIGLLPCPLTISVLGFAWAQSNGAMVAVVLVSLALGISLTIGLVAVLAIAARHALGASAGGYFSQFERSGRVLQAFASLAMIAIAVGAILVQWR